MNFPSPFRSLHSSLFIAFHRLSLPFIAAPSHCPPALCSPPFCPHLAPLSHHAPAFPRFTLASLLLHHPFCFTHPSFTHHCLRSFVLLPFFTPSIVLHRFALLSPIVLRPLFYFFPLCFTLSHCLPPSLYLLTLFCTRFLLPGNLRKPVPGTAKGNVFLIFQRNFAKSP